MKIAAIIAFGVAAGLVGFGYPVFSQTAPVFLLQSSPELPVAGDEVIITATPLNFEVSSTTFAWFRDGVALAASSGLGRSTTTIFTDPTQNGVIEIKVRADPGPEFMPQEGSIAIYTLPGPAQQEETLRNISSDFTLEASDINPSPGDNVEIRVVTFAFDKNDANYQWYVNGAFQKESSGRGHTRLRISSGAEGAIKTVRVDVTTPAGDARSKSITIETVSAPLYWWADTAIPYWYKGKALPALNSRVTVAALPGARSPNQLSYQWKFNDGVIPNASGFGKETFSFTLSLPIEEEISVIIKDVAGSFSKTAAVGVGPVSPNVGIYEVRPLRGIVYEKQLTEFSASAGDSYDFEAVPFFFAKTTEKKLNYRWSFNNQEISGVFDQPQLFTLKSKSGETSSSRIEIEVFDRNKDGERTFASFQADLR